MHVIMPAIERTIRTPIDFQIERIHSDAYEEDFPKDTPATVIHSWRMLRLNEQFRQLDERDDAVRACYGMPPRKYGYDKVHKPGSPTPPQVPTPRASSKPVTSSQRRFINDLLKDCAARNIKTDDIPGPKTSTEASNVIAQLKARLGL